jgi:uncharacterized protein with gpF-like domain
MRSAAAVPASRSLGGCESKYASNASTRLGRKQQMALKPTAIVGYRAGFPVKAGERGAKDFLTMALDASSRAKRPRPRGLRAVRPNLGFEVAYRKKLRALIDEMATSVEHWLRASYRKQESRIAQDASPTAELKKAINDLSDRWTQKLDEGAPALAEWFATAVNKRSFVVLREILREAGLSVRFTMTPAMKTVFEAIVEENVSLIKSIPQQYLSQVETIVMESVARGRDTGYLTRELLKRYDITVDRAKLIAIDQDNKATSALMKVRQTEMGIEEGVWLHSHAGKEPRPTHLANDNKKFSLSEGWFDPDPRVRRRIWPGELIRCRCTWRPIVKGFS